MPPAYDQDMHAEHGRAAAGHPESGCTGDSCAATPPPARPKRVIRNKPRRGPRITPVVHGEDPRFDVRAACGLSAAHLFDERERGEALQAYRRRVGQARTVCGGCPVAVGCLEFGVKNKLRGLFGGTELYRGEILETNARQSA